jgi:hypothetical protein
MENKLCGKEQDCIGKRTLRPCGSVTHDINEVLSTCDVRGTHKVTRRQENLVLSVWSTRSLDRENPCGEGCYV